MLKKFLILLLALMLPCAALADASSAVYRLYDYAPDGETYMLGTGVLVGDQTTLLSTVSASTVEGQLWAVGEGGAIWISRAMGFTDRGELAVLTLTKPSPATPLTLAPDGAAPERVLASDWDASQLDMYVDVVAPLTLREGDCVLYETAEDHLLPGGALLDEDGHLAGLSLYSYGEGDGRYVAITAEGIRTLMENWKAGKDAGGNRWLGGFTVDWKHARCIVDWSGCELPEGATADQLRIYFMDTQNPYYTYYPCEAGTTTQTLYLTPGRSYHIGLLHVTGEVGNIDLPNVASQDVTIPAAEPITLHNYHDSDFYLGVMPADWTDEPFTPVERLTEITAEALSRPDQALFWQAFTTYQTDEMQDCLMLFTLETPEGYCTSYVAGFIFDPSMQQSDVWHADVTHLFDLYLEFNGTGEYAPGAYKLNCFIDGSLCNSICWELD